MKLFAIGLILPQLQLQLQCTGFSLHRRHLLRTPGIGPNGSIGPIFSTTPVEEDAAVVEGKGGSKSKTETIPDDHNKNKIFLWLSHGRRVEAFREDQVGEEEEDDHRSRGLTSGAARFEGRYSASDWLHNFSTLPNSSILNEIRSPIILTTLWATLVSIVHFALKRSKHANIAHHLTISDKPHALMVSALSLLLVFRTNSAYQRFAEGRKIWERILTHSRDLSRMMLLYEAEIGKEKRRRVQRLLAAFPYLLRHRIRPNLRMRRLSDTTISRDPENSLLLYDDSALFDDDNDAATVATDEEEKGRSRRKTRELFWVDKRALPWRLLPGSALAACARAQNRPLWVCDRMAAELVRVPDQGSKFTNRERLFLLNCVNQISHTIGECERIHQTVVPLNYARHCLRGVTLWMLTLPFALIGSLGLITGPCLTIMSWLLYGIYQIGYNIEDPFQSTLRLSILCDAIRRDVFAEELLQRDTAFVIDEEEEKRDSVYADEGDASAMSADREDTDEEDEVLLERESDLYDEEDEVIVVGDTESLASPPMSISSNSSSRNNISPTIDVLTDTDYEDSHIVVDAVDINTDAAIHMKELHIDDVKTFETTIDGKENKEDGTSLVSFGSHISPSTGSVTADLGLSNHTHTTASSNILDENNAFE